MLNLRSYLKFLSRNKLYTFINVFGLSVSLMFVILIGNYAIGELTTDNFQANADRIYVLGYSEDDRIAYVPQCTSTHLDGRYPEIEKVCGITSMWTNKVEVLDKVTTDSRALGVSSTFFDMFSFEIIQGDKKNLFANKNSIILSERFAAKMFGDENPIGQRVQINDSLSYYVSGIAENFENSKFSYIDMIINEEDHIDRDMAAGKVMASTSMIFIQTFKGAGIISRQDDLAEYFRTFFWSWENDDSKNVVFTSFRDPLLIGIRIGVDGYGEDIYVITMLLIISGLVLAFAIFNYINLTVAQTSFRAKEMSTRRLLGASKYSIFMKMIFESTLLCGVAFVIGFFLAISCEPIANELIKNANISIIDDYSAMWIIYYITIIVTIGTISGLIPAIIIAKFKPIDVVKGSFTFKSKMTYNKIFITIQSVITILFIACSITVRAQVQYLLNADLGYNHKGVIRVEQWDFPKEDYFEKLKQVEQFYNILKQLPTVKRVGKIDYTPNRGCASIYNDSELGPISIYSTSCDSAALKIFDFEILEDNDVSGYGYWMNETAVEIMELVDQVGNLDRFKLRMPSNINCKGVIKDFVIGSIIRTDKHPYMLYHDDNIKPRTLLIEVEGDLMHSYREVEKAFKEMTDGAVFDAEFMSQEIAYHYNKYTRLSSILLIFTLVAILISSLGLLAISAFYIRQRSTEIAIRKVFGSTNTQVLKKLVWQFLRLVVVAFVIACPIIWYVMSEWLKEFPYRINLSVWIFLAAGAFTLLISFITVYWHSSIAANENPTKSIKK